MKKGKGCNLAAGIIDIILGACLLIGGLYYLIIGQSLARVYSMFVIIIISGVLCVVLGTIYLVFGILTIKYYKANPEVYYKRRKALLGFSIVETIIITFFIFSIVYMFDVLTIISILIYLSATVLHWVGYGLMAQNANGNIEMRSNGVEFRTQTYATPKVEARSSSFNEDIYTQLTKLNELRQNGIITEEEFQNMKNKLINK